MVTSFKGGVGKSTVAVNLAVGFAVAKYKVLIIDLDASSGSVDLFIGCEHDTLYNFCDVAEKKVKIQDAVYIKKAEARHNQSRNADGFYYSLDVLKAPPSYDINESLENSVGEFIEEAKEIYDFVIFDCPSGKFKLFEITAKKADFIFAVTLHSAASVRAAEKLAAYLAEITGGRGENVRLVINGFNPKGVAKGLNLGIVDIIERSKMKLIGLIPINNLLRDLQEEGKTVYDIRNKKIRAAFDDIIGRIQDNNIILNRKYGGVKTESLYFGKDKK